MTGQAVESTTRRPNLCVRFVRDDDFRFRVLTIGNVLNVAISSVLAAASASGPAGSPNLLILFPVVMAMVAMPLLSLGIVVVAALVSLLALPGAEPADRLRAYLRAFTASGAFVLGVPIVLGGAFFLIGMLDGLS